MSKPVKIISLVLALMLVMGATTGIAIYTANQNPNKIIPGISMEGTVNETPGAAVKMGENEIPFNEYRYYYLTNKAQVEGMYGADVWDNDFDHALEIGIKKSTEETLQDTYVWAQVAKELDIALSDEDKKGVEEELAELKLKYPTNFKEHLASLFFTDEALYTKINEDILLSEKTKTAFTAQVAEKNKAEIVATIISAQHILIAPMKDAIVPPAAAEGEIAIEGEEELEIDGEEELAIEGVEELEIEGEEELEIDGEEEPELTPEEKAAQMAQAKIVATEMVAMMRASEDPVATFGQLRTEYDSDGGQPEEGYTFGAGTMVEPFYQGALALKIGEISEPIETDFGYHIILRQEVLQSYVDENFEDLSSGKIEEYEKTELEKYREKLAVTKGSYDASIKPKNVQ